MNILHTKHDPRDKHVRLFLSSRKRHTSCTGDWSSDVCSSDLRAPPEARRRDGSSGRRDRAGAFRRRGLRMTAAVETIRDAPFTIGGRTFHSRLMVGTGKYRDNETMVRAIEASGAEIVTVAVRRVDLDRTREPGILYHLDPKKYFLLANTAGCHTAEDAVRYARLAREGGGFTESIRFGATADRGRRFPDFQALLRAPGRARRKG